MTGHEQHRPDTLRRGVSLGVPRTSAVARWATVAVAVIVGLGVVAETIRVAGWEFPGHEGVIVLLGLDSEFNIPSVFAALSLAACAALAALIGAVQRARDGSWVRHWWGLAAILLYLGIDDGARIHERTNAPLSELGVTAAVGFGWVVLGGLLALVVGLVYLPLWWQLLPPARAGILVAAALFVGGGLGMEVAGGRAHDRYGRDSVPYAATITVEETLEMAGIAVLFCTLWHLLGRLAPHLTLRFSPGLDTS